MMINNVITDKFETYSTNNCMAENAQISIY